MRYYFTFLALIIVMMPVVGQDDTEDCPVQIVFSSNMSGDFEIYKIDLPIENEIVEEAIQLTYNDGTDNWPRWSPNGELIAYQNSDYDIVILDADGKPFETLEHPETGEFAPSWLNNSNGVVFISTNGVETVIGIEIFWLQDYDPPPQLQLLYHMAIDEVRKNFPDMQPEAEEIYSSDRIALEADWDGNADIFVFSPDTQSRENLTDSPHDETTPAWSPDGSMIAFGSNETGTMEIWVIDVETRKLKQLTDFGRLAVAPRWSPDGSQIVFVGEGIIDSESDYDLYVMDSNGENVRRITNFEGNEGFPDWRPCPENVDE